MQITFLLQLLWASYFYTCFSFNLHNKLYEVLFLRKRKLKVQRSLPTKDLSARNLIFKLLSLTLKPIPYLLYHIVSPKSHSVYFNT